MYTICVQANVCILKSVYIYTHIRDLVLFLRVFSMPRLEVHGFLRTAASVVSVLMSRKVRSVRACKCVRDRQDGMLLHPDSAIPMGLLQSCMYSVCSSIMMYTRNLHTQNRQSSTHYFLAKTPPKSPIQLTTTFN